MNFSYSILIIGNNGKENSVCWKLVQSDIIKYIYIIQNNPWIERESKVKLINKNIKNPEDLIFLCKSMNIAMVIDFSDHQLDKEFSAKLQASNILYYEPYKNFYKIHQNDEWIELFLNKYDIPTANSEEYSVGEKVSLMAFTDGKNVVKMPLIQNFDNKIGNLDISETYPGVYCPCPLLSNDECEDITNSILQKIVHGINIENKPLSNGHINGYTNGNIIKRENKLFYGVLNVNFILTPKGPKVLNFNYGFNEPEFQVILPLLETDLFLIMRSCCEGTLGSLSIKWRNDIFSAGFILKENEYKETLENDYLTNGLYSEINQKNHFIFSSNSSKFKQDKITNNENKIFIAVGLASSIPLAITESAKVTLKLTNKMKKNINLQKLIEKYSKPLKKCAILISGTGGNMQAIIDATRDPIQNIGAEIVLVISNKPNVEGITRAENAGIKALVINHKDFPDRESFDREMDKELCKSGVEIICLAGFLRILSEEFVNKWKGSIINVHPSILPSFKGVRVRQEVLKSGVRLSGSTIHFVDAGVDTGAIIEQGSIPVFPYDTINTLMERNKEIEKILFPKALKHLASGRITLRPDNTTEWKY